MFGLPSLVSWVKARSGSDYYTTGMQVIHQKELIAFALQCGLAGYVPDAPLQMMLEDSRGAVQAKAWKAAALEELSILSSWGHSVWAGLCTRGLAESFTARTLHDKVMQAALVAFAFMDSECFQKATKAPWTLCQGDIKQDLLELKEAGPATEGTTWKVQQLLQRGHNLTELIAGVKLLQEATWSTCSVEQAHASVQMIRRHHPDYELNTLLLRSGIHTMRKLVPSG
eukprot:807650-Lingulodinium_polyedra.AAC.1